MRLRLWWPVLPILLLWACAMLQIAGEAREALERGLAKAFFSRGELRLALEAVGAAARLTPANL